MSQQKNMPGAFKTQSASRKRRQRLALLAAAAGAVALSSGRSVRAATPITWSSTAGTTAWASGTNWVGSAAPASSLTTNDAAFDSTSYASAPNYGTTSIDGLVFGDGMTATAALTLTGTALSTGADGVNIYANSGQVTLNGAVKLSANQTWTNNSSSLFVVGATITNTANSTPYTLTVNGSGNASFSGIISDGGGTGTTALIMAGTGTLTISGANSYSGGTTISGNAGTLQITNAQGFGTGAVLVRPGSVSGVAQLNLTVPGSGVGSSAANPNVISNAFNLGGQGTGLAAGGFGAIENVSGFNKITGNVTRSNTGGGTYNIVSDANTLELAGTLSSNSIATGTRSFDFGGAGNIVVSGVINNGTSGDTTQVVKDGAGTLTLSNVNSYTGATSINAGTLLANSTDTTSGSTGSNTVTVASGGTLGGGVGTTAGVVKGNITVSNGGTLTAGAGVASATVAAAPGILNESSGTTTLSTGSNFDVKVDNVSGTAVAGTNWDQIQMNLLSPSSGVNINLFGLTAGNLIGATPNFNKTTPFTLKIATLATVTQSTLNSDLADFTLNTSNFTSGNTTAYAQGFSLITASDFSGNGSDLEIQYSGTPEPGAAMLLLAGLPPMLARRRRRARAG